jgi:hypothetical protein
VILLVIIPGQMKYAMQSQDFYLFCRGMPQMTGLNLAYGIHDRRSFVKQRLSALNSRFVFTRTLIVPRTLAARRARPIKFSNAALLNPATRFRKMTMVFWARSAAAGLPPR